jgi:hypothetical protein
LIELGHLRRDRDGGEHASYFVSDKAACKA